MVDYTLLGPFFTHLCKLMPDWPLWLLLAQATEVALSFINHLHFKTKALKPSLCSSSHLAQIPCQSLQLQHYQSSRWRFKTSHLSGYRCTDTSMGHAGQHCLPGLSWLHTSAFICFLSSHEHVLRLSDDGFVLCLQRGSLPGDTAVQ